MKCGGCKSGNRSRRRARRGSVVAEYLIIMALCILIFVTILVPAPGSKMGSVYDQVRWAFRRAMVVISLPLL